MIRELTDAEIANDPLYGSLIEEHRDLIEEMGWSDASLVEQYNVIVTICNRGKDSYLPGEE